MAEPRYTVAFRCSAYKDNHYRVRLGDYRLIYAPQGDLLIVRVIRIGNRKDVYRHF